MEFFVFMYNNYMKCPITGKHCVKHKHLQMEGSIVCEDCFHKAKQPVQTISEMSCPSCGMKLAQIVKGSRFGCISCYDSFADMVPHIIAAVQTGDAKTCHVGMVPRSFVIDKSKKVSPEELRREISKKLESASANENYEEAAKMKGKMDELDSLLDSKKEGRGDLSERLAQFALDLWDESENLG